MQIRQAAQMQTADRRLVVSGTSAPWKETNSSLVISEKDDEIEQKIRQFTQKLACRLSGQQQPDYNWVFVKETLL